MLLECYRTSLVDAVAYAGQLIKSATTLPVLSCLRLRAVAGEGFRIEGTDLDHLGASSVEIDGIPVENGDFLVPAKLFRQAVARCDAARLPLRFADGKLKIGGFSLNTLPGSDFPNPEGDRYGAEKLPVEPATFARALRFVADEKEGRAYVKGVYVWRNLIMATDGRRAHVERVPGWTDTKRLAYLSRETAAVLAGMEKPLLELGVWSVRATDAGRFVIGKQLSEPNESFIPQVIAFCKVAPEAIPITVDRVAFLGALESAGLVADQIYGAVRLAVSGGLLRIESRASDQGSFCESIRIQNEIDLAGDVEFSAAFRAAYLTQAIRAFSDLSGESITVELASSPRPQIWLSSEFVSHTILGCNNI